MKKIFVIKEDNDKKKYYYPELIKFYEVKNEDYEKFLNYLEDLKIENDDKIVVASNERLKQLTFGVSDGCNLKCKYCYANSGSYGKEFRIMSSQKMMNAYQKVLKVFPKGIEQICFFGGEPMLGVNEICDFVNELNSFCMNNSIEKPKYYMVTNGTLFNDNNWTFFMNNDFLITVSLDGDKETNDIMRIFKNEKGSVYETVSSFMKKHLNETKIFAESTLTPIFFEKYDGDIKKYIDSIINLGFYSFFPFAAEGEKYDYFNDGIYNKVKLFYNDFCNYWLYELKKINSIDYQHIPIALISTIHLITSSERSRVCGSGRTTVFYGLSEKFYKCQMYYSDDISLSLQDLEKEIPYKPNFEICDDCISKNTCTFWCEGGAHLFGNFDKLSVRCVVQSIITECICKWLCDLTDDEIELVSNRISSIEEVMESCI